MTEAEKQLTRDVVAWYARELELGQPPFKGADVQFLVPEMNDDYEADTFRFSRARWLRAGAYAALFGLLLSALVFLWASWFSPVNILFFALTFALVWFFPVLAVVLRERAVVVYYGPGGEREVAEALTRDMAHQVALAYFNAGPLRECLHALVDVLLFPLALSYQEGVAAWFAAAYLKEREQDDTPPKSLRARNGRRLAWLVGRVAGRRAMLFVLRYG